MMSDEKLVVYISERTAVILSFGEVIAALVAVFFLIVVLGLEIYFVIWAYTQMLALFGMSSMNVPFSYFLIGALIGIALVISKNEWMGWVK